jgi:hypothetical protein
MKKIKIIFLSYFLYFNNYIFAARAPEINCVWLAWCPDSSITNPTKANVSWDFSSNVIWKFTIDFIVTFIQYIAIIAVISLMLWWIMYILSWWEDEKIKKAKSWIIWSAVWVFMSVSAWWIIKFITQLSISN